MIWKRCVLFLSLFFAFGFSLILSPNQAQAVSNEIGNFKTSAYVTQYRQLDPDQEVYSNSLGGWRYQNSNVYGMNYVLNKTVDFEEGDIITYSTVLINTASPTSIVNTDAKPPSCLMSSTTFTVVECSVHVQVISDYEKWVSQANITGTTTGQWGSTGNLTEQVRWLWDELNTEQQGWHLQYYYFQYKLRATKTVSTNQVKLTSWFNIGYPYFMRTSEWAISSSLEQGAIQAQEQEKQQGQQAQTDGQAGSSQSQSDATQASTSLLGAFSGFVGAITAISPSNCNITGNFGHLDIGTLNFCQDSPPAFVATILSLISVALLVPLSIHLAKRMLALFRSFTNG